VIGIRALRDEDHGAAARIWLSGSMGASEAELRARIARELACGWSAWLAWRDGVPVGFLAIQVEARRLDQLYVLPEAQGQGVGHALFEFAKARMPQGFWLHTDAGDARAGAFYERRGCRRGEEQTHPSLGHRLVVYRWP
jgi:putative acetyltransferase